MPARFLLLLALCLPSGLTAAQHVILITIDGFAAYQLLNQELQLPNIRALISQGVWAESSETVFPSVTHPSHTTIVTGVEPRLHGVLSNSMVNRRTGERFHPTNKPHKEIVKVPTLFDAAKAREFKTASFFWPESKDDPSVDFNLPEVFNQEQHADPGSVKPELLRELREADIPIDYYFRWYGGERAGAGDLILAEAAAYVVRKYKPNLLAIHFVSTDEAEHTHGPHHYLSQAAFTLADECVGTLRKAALDAGIKDDTVFIVTADHGFHSVYQEVNIWPAFAKSGLGDKVRTHGSGWSVAVELTSTFQPAADMPALEALFADLKKSGVVQRVLRPDDMHDFGQPRYEESDYVAGQYLLIPDIDLHLLVDSREGASMVRQPKRVPSHSHGYLPQHPRMYPSLVLSGAGIRRGVVIRHTRNIDIAPTVARLLNLEMPAMTGRVLQEALAER